jgi:hypothetical protein
LCGPYPAGRRPRGGLLAACLGGSSSAGASSSAAAGSQPLYPAKSALKSSGAYGAGDGDAIAAALTPAVKALNDAATSLKVRGGCTSCESSCDP